MLHGDRYLLFIHKSNSYPYVVFAPHPYTISLKLKLKAAHFYNHLNNIIDMSLSDHHAASPLPILLRCISLLCCCIWSLSLSITHMHTVTPFLQMTEITLLLLPSSCQNSFQCQSVLPGVDDQTCSCQNSTPQKKEKNNKDSS